MGTALNIAVLLARLSVLRPGADSGPVADAPTRKRAANLLESAGGAVVPHGDNLLACFRSANDACDAAIALMHALVEQGSNAPVARIVIEFGAVEIFGAEVSGAPVSRAAALIARVRPHGVLVAGELRKQLDAARNARVRGLSADETGELLWREGGSTQERETAMPAHPTAIGSPLLDSVRLVYKSETLHIGPARCPFTLGRDSGSGLTLAGADASRAHARIEFENGRFYLVDCSRNGTWLLTAAGDEVILRNERFPLVGRGVFAAGAPITQAGVDVLRYMSAPRKLEMLVEEAESTQRLAGIKRS